VLEELSAWLPEIKVYVGQIPGAVRHYMKFFGISDPAKVLE
jgi:hypothetical protein